MLALYPWSCSVNWCLAERQGNEDQHRPKGLTAREGLYIFLYSAPNQAVARLFLWGVRFHPI